MEVVKRVEDSATGAGAQPLGAAGVRAARGRAQSRVVILSGDRQVDRRTLLEADSLGAAGWQVTILAVPPGADPVEDDPRVVRLGGDARRGAAREGLVLRLYDHVRRRLPMEGRAMRALKAFAWGFVLSQENFHRRLFAPALPSHAAEVYLAQDLPMLPVAVEAARLHGAKVVYDSHELYTEQLFSAREQRGWRDIEARLVRRCDAVLTVNEGIAAELRQRYGLPRVHVVQNAERARADTAPQRRFHQRLGLPGRSRVLLMQGGLSAGRHLEVLVAAMAQVKDRDMHLVLLGDGRLARDLERQARRLGVAARVHLLPAVPQRELLAWTEAADAGVIPYQPTCLNNRLCTPNKLFEFIAAGLPVLASDLPEIRRIVEGHGVGQVSSMADATQLAQAIDAFFSEPSRLQAWRAAARRARTTLNWDGEGAKLVEVFEALR